MSLSAAIRRMIEAGLTIEQALTAAEAMEAEFVRPKSAGAIRQQRYRDRNKASQSVTSDAGDAEVSPKKESSPKPPKEKTTPSKSETKVSSKTPRAALETVLDADRAGQVIEHRQRLRKPLTVKAAQLLANQFAQCDDPNAGADAMILNGWQGFNPDWMDRAKQRGSPPRQQAPRGSEFFDIEAQERMNGRAGNDRGNQGYWDDVAGVPVLTIDHHR